LKGRDREALTHVLRSLAHTPLHPPLKKAVAILCQSVDEIKRNVTDHAAWPSPCERLKKAFRKTRKAGKKAQRTGRDTDFHTWRKKAKRLLYQLELTQAEPGRRTVRTMKRAALLQDTLGIYHDYVVVEEYLRHILPLPPAARRMADLLEKKKRHLRKKACKIARRLDASS
jgi:CHAD domain-containing protein